MSARPSIPSPTVGALLEQRHQVEDPAEPPLGGAQPDPAADFARSVREGHVSLPDWGDGWRPNGGHDIDCAYVGGVGPCTCADDDTTVPARPVEDVPVPGGVL